MIGFFEYSSDWLVVAGLALGIVGLVGVLHLLTRRPEQDPRPGYVDLTDRRRR